MAFTPPKPTEDVAAASTFFGQDYLKRSVGDIKKGVISKLRSSKVPGASPAASFGGGAAGRARVFEGFGMIASKKSGMRSFIELNEVMKHGGLSNFEKSRLQRYALSAATTNNPLKQAKRIERGRAIYTKAAENMASKSGIRSRIGSAIRATQTGWSEKGFFKASANALFSSRSLGGAAIGALAVAGGTAMAATKLNRWAEAKYRTENLGQGRFGTDTSGMLGPASLEGMRFQVMRRKRM